jgi:aspartate/methionine/tyrosine aminotransferase
MTMHQRLGQKVGQFTESVIREMTRQAALHGAVNLSQGFPDFPAPAEIKRAACEAIEADINQYAITWGAPDFRRAIANKTQEHLGLEIDPDREVVVTCGSTEGMIATLLALLNPGDELILFEPFYENYGPDAILTGARPRYVRLFPPLDVEGVWHFDPNELRAAFSPRTRAIIINTPHNPTGKVFSHEELSLIAELCCEFDAYAITDEIYEHIWYPHPTRSVQHTAIATLPGMRDRTVTINSLSKTFAVTGWRVGYVIGAPDLIGGIRQVHDFLTVGAAAPLQAAGAFALTLPRDYYAGLQEEYLQRRNFLHHALLEAGFQCPVPDGAYYIMADISHFGFVNDLDFTSYLIREIGVAAVPGSSFFRNPQDGHQLVRFCYCKREETLQLAADRLLKLRGTRPTTTPEINLF